MLTTLAPSSGEKHNQTCPYPCLRALLLRRLRRRIGSNLTPRSFSRRFFCCFFSCFAWRCRRDEFANFFDLAQSSV
jgi:hypothetical protein